MQPEDIKRTDIVVFTEGEDVGKFGTVLSTHTYTEGTKIVNVKPAGADVGYWVFTDSIRKATTDELIHLHLLLMGIDKPQI